MEWLGQNLILLVDELASFPTNSSEFCTIDIFSSVYVLRLGVTFTEITEISVFVFHSLQKLVFG